MLSLNYSSLVASSTFILVLLNPSLPSAHTMGLLSSLWSSMPYSLMYVDIKYSFNYGFCIAFVEGELV